MTTKTMRPRQGHDYYPTPESLVVAALDKVTITPATILDPGAGDGVWGRVAFKKWNDPFIVGIDIREVPMPECYTWWKFNTDFLEMKLDVTFNLVMGNPPYNKAEEFIRKGYAHLTVGGQMVMLLRLAFLESQKRAKGLWKELRPKNVYVLGRRPSFTGNGKTDATAYMVALFEKDWSGITELDWLEWKYEDNGCESRERVLERLELC
jgi:hypothetical protein